MTSIETTTDPATALATRRATLRQVNANLLEISRELRQMRNKTATCG